MKRVLAARLLLAGVLTFACGASALGADEVARVRTQLGSDPPLWVGQKVSFHVDLMSSTFFSGSPRFDLPEIPGAIIVKVEGRPVISTEQVDGESWSIQRHEFSIYPHQPGRFTIVSFPVRFSVAPAFGKPRKEQRLKSQSVTFEAQLPPGAEGLSLLISTPELDVEEVWTPPIPEDGQLTLDVGDAITRRISIRARDVPGMALPEIVMPVPDGAAAYPKQPTVRDKENRGELTGERIDEVTFVCERPGELVLPALVVSWWDTDSQALKTERLRALTVSVKRNLDASQVAVDEVAAESESLPTRRLIVPVVIVFLLGGLCWWYRHSLQAKWQQCLKTYRASESSSFHRFVRAARANDPSAALRSLMRWLDHIETDEQPAQLATFLKRYGDPKSHLSAEELVLAAQTPSARTWDGRRLITEVNRARKRYRSFHRPSRTKKTTLPDLNPQMQRAKV